MSVFQAVSAIGLVLAAVAPLYPEYSVYLLLAAASGGAIGGTLSANYGSKALTVIGVLVAIASVVAPSALVPAKIAVFIGALGAAAAALGKSLFDWNRRSGNLNRAASSEGAPRFMTHGEGPMDSRRAIRLAGLLILLVGSTRPSLVAAGAPADFTLVIGQAYREILEREPDPSGLAYFNQQMMAGMSEAAMREALLRSAEFAIKHPWPSSPPPPSPSPSPTPLPSPLPGPPMAALRVVGNTFLPSIFGAAAGSGSIPYGWPDASEEYLRALADRGLNYVHTRTGPFVREGEKAEFEGYVYENGLYDLSRFNPAYDQKERDFLAAAQAKQIYVERVVLDDWPAKNGLWPYAAGRNLQGVDFTAAVFEQPEPPPEIQAWVQHRVANTCAFPNVFYALDNEPAAVSTSADWTRRLYTIVKDEMVQRGCEQYPVGSGNSDAWDTVDYQILHTFRLPAPSLNPVLVNETDNRFTTPTQYVLRAYAGQAVGGIYFQFWPGPMEERPADVIAVGDLYSRMERGLPPPAGFDGPSFGCPAFRGIKVEILQVQGTKYTMNASPLPKSEGADPATSLGSTLCEDLWVNSKIPQRYQDGYGPTWRIVQGPGSLEVNWRNPYLAFVYDPGPGTIIEACSQADSNCGRFVF